MRIIGNGDVILGVDDYGNLGVEYAKMLGMPSSDPTDIGFVGLRSGNGDDAGDYSSTEAGNHCYIIYHISYTYHKHIIYTLYYYKIYRCLCEGWGVSVDDTAISTTRDSSNTFEVISKMT